MPSIFAAAGLSAMLALALGPEDGPPAARVLLRWSAPASCPSEATARASLRALTGATLVDDPPTELTAAIEIVASNPEHTARIHIVTAQGQQIRELVADDCDVLARAAVLVVAVGLDAVAVVRRSDEANDAGAIVPPMSSSADPTDDSTDAPIITEPTIASSNDDATPDSPRAPRRGPAGLELGGRLGLGVGGLILPGVGLGITAGPYVGTRRVHVRLEAQYFAPRRVFLSDDPSVGARMQLATVGVRACGILERGRVRAPLCAGVDAGAVLARGIGDGLSREHHARAPWAGVVLAPGIAIEVTRRVSVWLAVEGAISLYRARFHIDRRGDADPELALVDIGAFGPRAFAGVELHAPRRRR